MIEKKPFTRYSLEDQKKRDIFTVALNDEERETLDSAKVVLNQVKDSTALKSLAWIGSKVLQAEQTRFLLDTIYSNKRKNKRLGINEF